MPPVLLALLTAAAASLAACQHLTPEQCERLCWRYNDVATWERFEAETRSLAPAEREKRRAEQEKALREMRARPFDPGLDNCVRDCRHSASPEDLACVERATTSAQMNDCLD